jgi:probable F420-dependent oxidoreductase
MKFGVSFGDAPVSRSLELVELAEQSGFDQAWSWDSHILWSETYSLLGYLAAKTSHVDFGTCVTNPRTRDATVLASAFATIRQMLDGRRIICGIGKGDSSVRLMRRGPAKLADLERTVDVIRGLGRGDVVDIEGVPVQIGWTSGETPVYIAAYGPNALRLAGRKGDGVIFQIADPYFIEWAMGHVREGAEEAGRSLDGFTIHCAIVSYVSDDLEEAREQCRWYPAMVGNHIADTLRYHDPSRIPNELRDFLEQRSSYDYHVHAEQGTEHSRYVPDEIIDRFCVIGSVDAVRAKLEQLAALGVGEVNLYPHVGEFESVVETYGREFLPALGSRAGA